MKRPNGSGSVFQLGDGRWRAQFTIALRPRRMRTRTVATEAEARAIVGDPPSIEERFWSHVVKGDGCWEWQGARGRNGTGYGNFARQAGAGDFVPAHRFAYELVNGPIPAGLQALHHCDNVICVRPDHLFTGTRSDNMRDMHAKGRHRGRRPERDSVTALVTGSHQPAPTRPGRRPL